ncbi:glycosyl transferase family 2 [Chthoniobacter flavus Ellin428]|uniref:Glycosyl transferase family 2 n=1 Tax=Chthoniobacter flavus Ellin428 TaxID=497964 RepID=B4CW28_9BACT|nr:glycosyltransferase family 2 protein [Chthoniobacter flavus]EDY21620.1 glycosyl transferase family 2 [Chthoniobacter flavus Ellin428]TCO95558.1 glycosyl transferase family 2 [Chthoniobacter flavus]
MSAANLGPLVLAVPVFNGERFLAETLASLNEQGDDVRWWMQDGASKDGTVEIARRFVRPCDKIVSEPDSGQPDALNRAFQQMGGEIIGFLNADDTLLPGTARKVLDYFAAHPDVDLVCGEIEWIDEHSNVTGRHAGRIHSLAEVLDIYGVWWANRQWVQPEVFFRRSLWEKAGLFDPKWNLVFDYEFWIRCFRAGARVAHLSEPLTRFRIHGAQKSAAATNAADEIRAVVRKHLDDGAPLPAVRRWKLEAELSYDLYQGGKNGTARGSFPAEVLRHPQWLLSSPARARLWAACTRRLKQG